MKVFIFIPAFISWLSCHTHAEEYGQSLDTFLNRTITVCAEAKCEGSCSQPRRPERSCHCDAICETYGDCCYDFWQFCKNETLELNGKSAVMKRHLVCRSIGGEHCEEAVKMVAGCPEDYPSEHVKVQCKANRIGSTLPVLGMKGYLYANKFCAKCSGEKFDDLVQIPVTLECPNRPDIVRLLENITVNDAETWLAVRETCHYSISVPSDLRHKIRFCNTFTDYNVYCEFHKGTFSSYSEFRVIRDACSSYQGFVGSYYQYRDQSYSTYYDIFRNSHCAICKGVEPGIHNITCPKKQRRTKRQVCYIGPKPPPVLGPSFSVLLDFGANYETSKVQAIISCPENQIFNSLSGSCSEVMCLPGFELKENKCQRKNSMFPANTFKMEITSEFWTSPEIRTCDRNATIALLEKHGLSGNFTHQSTSQSAHQRAVEINYFDVNEDPNTEGSRKSLDFCLEYSQSTNLFSLPKGHTVFRCTIIGLGEQNCEHTAFVNGSMDLNALNKTPEYVALLKGIPPDSPLTNVTFVLGKTASTTFANWSIYFCTVPLSEVFVPCPLTLVDKSSIVEVNVTHLTLVTGDVITATDFQLVGNDTFICAGKIAGSIPIFTILPEYSTLAYYMTTVGLSLSVIALSLTLIVYNILPQLRTVPGKILMNLSLSLLLAQFFFVFGAGKIHWPTFCLINGIAEHYLWLVSFLWMSVISVDLAKTFVSSSLLSTDDRGRTLLICYTIFSWLTPLVHVLICFLLDFFDAVPDHQLKYMSPHACFLSGYEGMLYAFVLPLTIIMVINVVCFVAILIMLARASSLEKKIQKNRIKRNQLFLLAKLLPITGLTWIFGLLAKYTETSGLWHPFIVFNSLQGVFVFFAFVGNRRVTRMLQLRLSSISSARIYSGTSDTRF